MMDVTIYRFPHNIHIHTYICVCVFLYIGTRRDESGFVELGDIIVEIEDYTINNEVDLLQSLESFKPGDKVRVTVERAESLKGEIRMKELIFIIQLRAQSDSVKIKLQ